MVKIDFLAWETETWISGTKDFLEILKTAISDAATRESEALQQFARDHDIDPGEHQMQILEHKFGRWLPRVSAYSVMILLQSLVETQLKEYAKRLRATRNIRLNSSDLRGQGFEPEVVFITKVACVDIANDLGWQELRNLQELRNIIVHRRGRQGASIEQQNAVQRLIEQYKEDLSLSESPIVSERELEVSFRLCSYFLEQVEAFFQRLCIAAGFQERGWKS